MSGLRVAFTGASGTGKTTLTKFVADAFGLPICPVGSRYTAKEMGFTSPYDVDAAGMRAPFQRAIVAGKRAWENEHEAFVTDRTHIDSLVYHVLHDVTSVTKEDIAEHILANGRYTHIFHCPVSVFVNTGTDPVRLHNEAYQDIFGIVLESWNAKVTPRAIYRLDLRTSDLDVRKRVVTEFLRG